MTEKRFEVMDYFDSENKSIKAIRDNETTEIYSMDNELEANSTCKKMNTLHEENLTLKQENQKLKKALKELKEIGDYQEMRIIELQEFEDTVFDSLNNKIKGGEEAIEWGKSIGADVGSMGFHIELLKKFKKELFK